MMQCKNENQISAFLSGYPWNIGPVMLPSTLSLLEKAHLPAPSFSLLSNISLMNNINNNFNAITKSKSEADQNALCKVGCSQRAEIVEIDVEDRDGFGPLYQRNNKQIGIKNLRCFPNCGEFHKEKGFCGHSVTIRTNIKQGSANKSKYVAVAEFLHEEQPHRFNIGEIVSSSSIFALCRTKSDPCLPLILGSLVSKSNSLSSAESEPNSSSTLQSSSSDMMRFEFNKERRGWHYGWTANKHTCEMSHNLVCYLFETCESSDGVSSLRLIATTKSPSFIVFGRRRKRYTVLPTAPTAPPKTRVKKQKREESEDETDEGCPSSPTPALSTSSGDSTPTFSSTQPIVNAPKLQEAIDLPFMIHVSTLTNPFAQTPIVDDPANNQQIKKRRFEDSTASSLSSEAQDLKNNINEMAKILCMLSTCGGSATLA